MKMSILVKTKSKNNLKSRKMQSKRLAKDPSRDTTWKRRMTSRLLIVTTRIKPSNILSNSRMQPINSNLLARMGKNILMARSKTHTTRTMSSSPTTRIKISNILMIPMISNTMSRTTSFKIYLQKTKSMSRFRINTTKFHPAQPTIRQTTALSLRSTTAIKRQKTTNKTS